jgi:integrase
VVAIKPVEEKRKREDRAWSVSEVQATMKKMKPELAEMFWTMCLTGCGLEEYEHGLIKEGDHGVRVQGFKMTRIDDRRNRVVPRVIDPAPMVLRVKQFRKHLKAANPDMQVYDARRCYARWCLEAGIPFDRVQQYMGHAPKSMTERYARSTVQQHLKDDAERLRQWIETQRKLKTNTAISRFFDT